MKFNPAIATLKFVACTGVVWIHYGVGGSRLTMFCVPLFMFLAVFLSSKTIWKGDVLDLRKRVRRILVPYVLWSGVCWLVFGVIKGKLSLSRLAWQIIFGHCVCKPLYFMWILAVTTMLLFYIYKCRTRYWILGFLCLGSFILQYLGLHVHMLDACPSEAKYTLGRFIELFPIAVTGLAFAVAYERGSVGFYVCMMLLIGLVLTAGVKGLGLHVFPPGFGYGGFLMTLIPASICIVAISAGRESPTWLSWTAILGKLSVGVYLSHIFVGEVILSVSSLQKGFLLSAMVFGGSCILTLGLIHTKLSKLVQ